MVTVAYIGNFLPSHSTENHVRIALNNLGHEVRPIQESGFDWTTLPPLVEGADLLLWTRTAGYDPADLEGQAHAIKSLDVPSAGFHLDRWVGLNREPDVHRSPFFRLDHLFTADGGHPDFWLEHGINHHWSPPAILSDEAKRVGVWRKEFDYPVGFVGSLRNYGHPEWGPYRRQLYRFLDQTYRGRFKLWEGGIRGQDLADLYASVKVLVGDSCLAGDSRFYWSDRSPECAGRGGFLIHPWTEGYEEAFPMIPTYSLGDFDQLGSLINYYLSPAVEEERLEIAAEARAHVLATATYEHKMERVLAIVLS